MRIEEISSVRNPRINEVLALQEKSRLRRELGKFVVEGRRELGNCLRGGFEAEEVFFCPECGGSPCLPEIEHGGESRVHFFRVSREVYEKIAYRGGTEGMVAVVKAKERGLDALSLGPSPLIMVLEAVEKPGNLGAVLRSADAAGADAVIVCDPLTDLYNPNLIRASIGAVFSRQVACASSEETITWLKERDISIYTAQLQDSLPYYDTDMKHGIALVMGTESTGLTEIWRKAADRHIRIPMLGALDSLNVSVSAAILMFEAVRQRNT